MGGNLQKLQRFLDNSPCIRVEISVAKGSCPRDQGTWMLVSENSCFATIGGGQLEYIAIDSARQMLRSGEAKRQLDVPLGPEIGQCCGGRVGLWLSVVDEHLALELSAGMKTDIQNLPHCYIMGAGHVGRALALAMSVLPFRTIVVDTRKAELENLPLNVETRLSAMPEEDVRGAPAHSIFVILTHDHALDFLIAEEALTRGDASYVGMIGSKTKRSRFTSWAKEQGIAQSEVDRLVCPIGRQKEEGKNLNKGLDKRPEVISALVAAEILVHTGMSLKKKSGETEGCQELLR